MHGASSHPSPRNVASLRSRNQARFSCLISDSSLLLTAERRFAPTTVRYRRISVRYESEWVSDFIGIRRNTERLELWRVHGFLPLPVDTANPPPCPWPLGSLCLSQTSSLLRAIPPLRTAFLLQLSQGFCLSRSVRIGAEGSHVPLNRRVIGSCHLNAGGRRARNRHRPCSSRVNDSNPVSTSFLRFRHVISGSLAFISRSLI